jgi:hypothetical protein
MHEKTTQRVEYAALTAVKQQFDMTAAECELARDGLPELRQRFLDGTGTVADQVGPGVETFVLSWRAALDVVIQSAGLVSKNVGAYSVDLATVDVGSTFYVKL